MLRQRTSPEEETKISSQKKSSTEKNSSKIADLEERGELKEEDPVQSDSRRFLEWTSEDVFDWNPEYARTVRGIFTLLQIVLSALVMIMVGSGCNHLDKDSLFYCQSSAAFMFVVASSALIQSTFLVLCCLLSKKGDAIIKAAPLELLYYIVYTILYLIAGLVLETKLRSGDGGHHAILAGGIFGLTNSVLYLISAVWSFMYFQKKLGRRDEE